MRVGLLDAACNWHARFNMPSDHHVPMPHPMSTLKTNPCFDRRWGGWSQPSPPPSTPNIPRVFCQTPTCA